MAEFQITSGEVLEVLYGDSNPNLIYGIKVKPLDNTPADDETTLSVITAKPLNTSILRIPIKGEVVLLLNAPSSYASGTSAASDTYYFDIVSLQSSIHHNALPTISSKKIQTGQTSGDSDEYNETSSGNTNTQEEPKIDENFSENPTVKPLQPYIGDLLIEGRYGNSIRFSTTPKSGKFTVDPKWSGGSESAPITIFRNSKQGTDTQKINDFITEDFTNNENIIVMASGQSIEFEQGSGVVTSIQSKGITSWQDETWGTTPQTLISSGRLIFNSSQKEIIAFAKNGIGLSTETNIAIDAKDVIAINSTKIELGDGADEPLILGNSFKSWVESLIDTLSTLTVLTPAGPSSPLSASPEWASIASLKGEISNLLSDLSFTKKSVSTSSRGSSRVLPIPDFTMTPAAKKEVTQVIEEAKAVLDNPDPEEPLTPEQEQTFKEFAEFNQSQIDNNYFADAEADEWEIDDLDIDTVSKNNYEWIQKEVPKAEGGAGIGGDSGVPNTSPVTPGSEAPDTYVSAAVQSANDIPKPYRKTFTAEKATLAKDMYNYMISKGWPDNQARALLANAVRETALTVGIRNIDVGNGKYDAGLWQWNGAREAAMTKSVRNWSTNWQGQIDYILTEEINKYGRTFKTAQFASAEEASIAWREFWEISKNARSDNEFNAMYLKYLFPPGLIFPNVSSTNKSTLDEKSRDAGATAAKLAVKDADDKVREQPLRSNFGGKVTEYLKSAGVYGPAKWCASAVTYWWKEAGLKVPPGSSGVINWEQWATKNGQWSLSPVIGAACVYKNSHIGIVVDIINGKIITVNGNASIAEYGKTIGVSKRQVNLGEIKGFVIPKV